VYRRKWENNIKMGLQEIILGDMEGIISAPGRGKWREVVKTVMNFRVRQNSEKFLD
jgi:hypothetical protein